MNNLERLGLEVVAYTLLGSRAQAAALLALLDAKGRPVHWPQLGEANGYRFSPRPANTPNAVAVRVCLLRESLADVGLLGVVLSVPKGEGPAYYIPEPHRSAVMARLIQEASHD